MNASADSDDLVRRLIKWARGRDGIRAALLTGSRANPQAQIDVLSDYDAILVVRDVHPFFTDRAWLHDLGTVLVVYWDPIHPAPGYDDVEEVSNVTQYRDGLKIDFTLWPVDLLRRIADAPGLPDELDAGYMVLVDKDRLTDGLLAPTYTAHIPTPPTEEAYRTLIEEFLSDAPYVAKCLRRDELLPATWCLECDMKHKYLRRMLEWRMECDHGWAVPTGSLGRGLKRRLPPKTWAELERTYAGAGIDENWEVLWRTMALFRRVAVEVADRLGYAYPYEVDRGVTAYVRDVQGPARPDCDSIDHERRRDEGDPQDV